jgi:hypothetical protein
MTIAGDHPLARRRSGESVLSIDPGQGCLPGDSRGRTYKMNLRTHGT